MARAIALARLLLAANGLIIAGSIAIAARGEATPRRLAHVGPRATAFPVAGDMDSMGMAMSDAGMARLSMASMTLAGFVSSIPSSGHGDHGSPATGGAGLVSVASLGGPRTAARVSAFTLTARPARVTLRPGTAIDAWTYNGTAPGPVLRVRQGDLVVVHLVNRLPVPTTIHWHGIDVPGGEDGVAGMTQDAVLPGREYTYRFIANEPGTYWYHAHQDSLTQVGRGLFGSVVVEPRAFKRDRLDAAVTIHTWRIAGKDVVALNASAAITRLAARPGSMVRLRFVNTDNSLHTVTIDGAPFTVAALDGHDLNDPTPLRNVSLPIGAGQRYDVRFRVPASGAVAVRVSDVGIDQHQIIDQRLLMVVGAGKAPCAGSSPGWFDMTRYGVPVSGAGAPFSHPQATYDLRLGSQGGFSITHPGLTYTINGNVAPRIAPIVVTRGEVVRLRIMNETTVVHPMHLHGHELVVLTRNGRPLSGSPIRLDTLDVFPNESYDVAFVANNPGVWMLHCHNLNHARTGMSMMVMYKGVTTPFKDGGPVGNVMD